MGRIIQKIVLGDNIRNVWKFITEPENFPKYVYGYFNGKTTSQNRTGVGASYKWYGKLGPLKFKSTEEVIEWRKRKRVVYIGRLFGVIFNSSMDVKEMNKERTILTVFIKYKVPVYLGGVITDLLLIKWIIQDYIKKSLGRLKKVYE